MSVNATMDAILKRLQTNKKAHRNIYEIKRSENIIVLGASCFELCRESLGRLLVKQIKDFRYANKPERIGFSTSRGDLGVSCDVTEVLIICYWAPISCTKQA